MSKPWYTSTITRIERVENAGKRPLTLKEANDLHVARAVAHACGCISEAARALGIDRRSLQRKIARIRGRR